MQQRIYIKASAGLQQKLICRCLQVKSEQAVPQEKLGRPAPGGQHLLLRSGQLLRSLDLGADEQKAQMAEDKEGVKGHVLP